MKFLVPNYSCLQISGLPLPDPRSLCPLSSTEFVEPPPEKKSWVRHCSVAHLPVTSQHTTDPACSECSLSNNPQTVN